MLLAAVALSFPLSLSVSLFSHHPLQSCECLWLCMHHLTAATVGCNPFFCHLLHVIAFESTRDRQVSE